MPKKTIIRKKTREEKNNTREKRIKDAIRVRRVRNV